MLESETRLRRDVVDILDSLRGLGEGSYAAAFDAKAIVAESSGEEGPSSASLRHLLQTGGGELLRLPGALQRGDAMSDLFAGFAADEFLLAVVNGKIGVLVACADAQKLQTESARLVQALVDRLLRIDPAWRYDEKGRGIFFGSPRLDTVVIPRPDRDPDA